MFISGSFVETEEKANFLLELYVFPGRRKGRAARNDLVPMKLAGFDAPSYETYFKLHIFEQGEIDLR